jgi:hypothetical protein
LKRTHTRLSVRLPAIMLAAGALVAAPRFLWSLHPATPLSFVVLDKTVPDDACTEHLGIFWVLRNSRFMTAGHLPDPSRDYVGFHPASGRGDTLTDARLRGARIVYLADAYGVYDYRRGHRRYEQEIAIREADLTLQYGGLVKPEVDALSRRFPADAPAIAARPTPAPYGTNPAPGGCLVAEFNVLSYPTSFDSTTWQALQSLLHVEYTGWFGRYYDDLAGAARGGRKILYERLSGKPWNFTGPGLVIVHEAEVPGWKRDIVVLTREDLEDDAPRLELPPDLAARTGGVREIPFTGYFDLVSPERDTEVMATLRLGVNGAGRAKLALAGLPSRFPAIIRWRGGHETLYLAGNFARETAPRWAERNWGYREYATLNARSAPGWRSDDFFWLFYRPFLHSLFMQYRGPGHHDS